MVEFTVNKNDFKKFVDALHPLLYECKIDITSEQLHVAGIDTSNICFITVDYFKNLDASDIGSVYIQLSKVSDFINKCKEENIYVTISKQSASFECGNLNLDITLYKNNSDEKTPPAIPTSVDITVDGNQFYNAIRSASGINEKICFTTLSDCMIINIDDNSDKYEWRIDVDEVIEDMCDEVIASYSYEYIKDISVGLKQFEKVNIKYGTDLPLIIGGINDEFTIEYILAPRVA